MAVAPWAWVKGVWLAWQVFLIFSLARFLNDPELYARLDSVAVALDSLEAQVAEDPLGSVNIDLR